VRLCVKMSFLTHTTSHTISQTASQTTSQTAITLMTALSLQESRAKFSKNVSRVLKAVDWPEGRKPNRPHSHHHHHHQDGSATPHQSQGMMVPYIKIYISHKGLLYISNSACIDRSTV